jgi:DNA invertase Pin-like site-specific DNA recombinase
MDTSPAIIEAYTRKSRALGDPDDPALLAHHVALLQRLAEADGVTLSSAAIYTEIGSGETISDRPVFAARLAAWERLPPGISGLVYVPEVARLSRGEALEVARVVSALQRAGLKVRTPGRTYDLNNADDRLFFGLLALVAQHELGKYKERAALKRHEMNRRGQLTTGKPCFGYVWDKNRSGPVAHPENFPVLVRLCRRALEVGLRQLEAEFGLDWQTIRGILHCPMICGRTAIRHALALPGKLAGHAGRRRYRRLAPEEWVWGEVEGDWPKACTWEEWGQIQARLDERYTLKGKGGFMEQGWCRDVVEFEGYPGPVTLGSVGRGGRKYYTYDHYFAPKRKVYVAREPVHAAAYAALLKAVEAPELLRLAVEAEQARLQAEASLAASLPGRDALLHSLTAERARLAVLKEEGAGDIEDRRANREAQEKVKRRIEALKEQLRPAQVPPDPLFPLPPDLTIWGQRFVERWPLLTGETKRRLTRGLIEAVVIRLEERPRPQAWVREVARIEYVEWLAPYMSKSG